MSTHRRRWGSLAASGAGILWLAHVLLVMGAGVVTGQLLQEAPLARLRRIDGTVVMGVFFLLGIALQEVHAALRGREKLLGVPGVLLSLAPLAAGLLGGLLLVLDPGTARRFVPFVGMPALLGSLLSAFLLGAATLRARELPRYVGVSLVAFALLTMPLALALPLLRGALPLYALAETQFVFAGVLWIVVGVGLRGAVLEPGAGFVIAQPEARRAPPLATRLPPDEGLRRYAALRAKEVELQRERRRLSEWTGKRLPSGHEMPEPGPQPRKP